jgi:uncharacterized protein YceK
VKGGCTEILTNTSQKSADPKIRLNTPFFLNLSQEQLAYPSLINIDLPFYNHTNSFKLLFPVIVPITITTTITNNNSDLYSSALSETLNIMFKSKASSSSYQIT